jgi:hypothetical protein
MLKLYRHAMKFAKLIADTKNTLFDELMFGYVMNFQQQIEQRSFFPSSTPCLESWRHEQSFQIVQHYHLIMNYCDS